MVRKLTVNHGDLWIDIDLCFSSRLSLVQWRKIVKLAGEYNPEQLEGVAEYFREMAEEYQRLIDNEETRLALAEIEYRTRKGKKSKVNFHRREIKTLQKSRDDMEKRRVCVLATMEKVTGRAAALMEGVA